MGDYSDKRKKTTVIRKSERRNSDGKLLSLRRSKEIYYDDDRDDCQEVISPATALERSRQSQCNGRDEVIGSRLETSHASVKKEYARSEGRSKREELCNTRAPSHEYCGDYWSVEEKRTEPNGREYLNENHHSQHHSACFERITGGRRDLGHVMADSSPTVHSYAFDDIVTVRRRGVEYKDFSFVALKLGSRINDLRKHHALPLLTTDEYLMLRSKTIALRVVLENSTRAFDEEKGRGCPIMLWIGSYESAHAPEERILAEWWREAETAHSVGGGNYFADGTLRKIGVASASFIGHGTYFATVAMFE